MLAISRPLCVPAAIPLSDEPAQIIQIQFPGAAKHPAKFRRTSWGALPLGALDSKAKILAHFREDVDQWARHLVVLENNCFMVLCVDQFNPDRGFVEAYQKVDVETPATEEKKYDGMTPFEGMAAPSPKVAEASARFKSFSKGLQDKPEPSPHKVKGLVALQRPTGLPTLRGTIVKTRGPSSELTTIQGASPQATRKTPMLQFLANCQRDLTLQAILQFICSELEDNAKIYSPSDGEEDLLEEVKKLQWSSEKIRATQTNEETYLKQVGNNIRSYYLLLHDMKDDLQHKVEKNPSEMNQLAFMAIDELISMQERAGGDRIVAVAFTVPYIKDIIEEWILDVGDVFDIDEEDLDRPVLG